MIVDCPSCGATYNISDEKVRGRRVRVRCKNCSGPIIVDGEQIEADDATRVYQPNLEPNTYEETRVYKPEPEPNYEETRVYKPQLEPNTYEEADESTRVMTVGAVGGGHDGPAPGAWTVNVSESDQRTMTLEEIVDTYNSGFITEEAFVWRDGMSDWVALMEVEEIRSAIESNQATHVVKPAVMRAQARRSAMHPPTPISYSAPAAAPPRARVAAAPASSVEYAPRPRALPSSPEPARLRASRQPGQDLFGGVASAGSEQELLKSSALPAQDSGNRPIGARNESSVLFSLNTVRAGVGPTSAPPRGLGAAPPPPTAAEILGMDASGALPGVDMNAALASAPAVEPPPQRITMPPARGRMDTLPPTGRRRGRPLLIAVVVFVATAMVAALAVLIRARHATSASASSAETPRTAEPVAAATAATAPPASAAEPPPAPQPPVSAAPAEPAVPPTATAPAAPEPPQQQLPAPMPVPKAAPGRPLPQPRPEKPTAKPESAAKGDQKIVLEEEGSEAPAAAAPKPAAKEEAPAEAPAPEPDKPPFDMSAAKAALEGAAASAAACKSDDGPTGRGKVQVTFSPSGRVTSANVVEGAFGGTPVGGCIAKVFRSAKVPAFSGDPVTVAKAFTIPE
jgi:predicted Zn finger-like uncharacterized protein